MRISKNFGAIQESLELKMGIQRNSLFPEPGKIAPPKDRQPSLNFRNSHRLFCKYCGYKNDSDAQWCQNCGKKIESEQLAEITCPSCGTKGKAQTIFCKNCGIRLQK